MKIRTIKEIHNNGLIFLINKEVLHPLGMEIGITPTSRKFSYYDTSKQLIETSLELKDVLRKFEELEKTVSNKPKFIQSKLKKMLSENIMILAKLEPKCGIEIKTGKTKVLITREQDGHDEKEGITLSPFVRTKEEPTEEFVYDKNGFDIYNKMLIDFMNKEGNFILSNREKQLGYIIQEETTGE